MSPYFFILLRSPPTPTLFPYTTLFRSPAASTPSVSRLVLMPPESRRAARVLRQSPGSPGGCRSSGPPRGCSGDRKSTRLNSSHSQSSYAVFCLKKKRVQTTVRRYQDLHRSPVGPSSRCRRTSLYCYGHHRHLHSFPTRRSSDLPPPARPA